MDFVWRDAGLVVEIDGQAVHRTTQAFHEDRRRDRMLAAQGFLVVREREPTGAAGPPAPLTSKRA